MWVYIMGGSNKDKYWKPDKWKIGALASGCSSNYLEYNKNHPRDPQIKKVNNDISGISNSKASEI